MKTSRRWLLRALDEYVVGGIRTNLSLFRRILIDEDFIAARIDTGYLDRLLAQPKIVIDDGHENVAALAAALFEVSRSSNGSSKSVAHLQTSAWKSLARREALRK